MSRQGYSNPSIISEVILRIISATAAFSLLLAFVLYFQIESTMVYVQNEAIGDHAKEIASYIEIQADGKIIHDLPERYKENTQDPSAGVQYLVMDSDGNVLFSSKETFFDPFNFVPTSEDELKFFETLSPKGEKLLGAGLKRSFGGRQFTVYAAESEGSIRSFTSFLVNTFLYKAAVVGIPLILLLLLVVILTLRQGFAPLVKISSDVKKIDYDNIDVHLSETYVPVEILPLVKAVNRALSRLRRGIENQKEFTANAAHEIRTPLAVLKARIQKLGQTQDVGLLSDDVDEMTRLVNQMLEISKLDCSDNIKMDRVDLNEVVRQVCVDLGPLFISASREIRLAGAEEQHIITGNREAIYRAVRNIVENAIKYSPAGSPVEIDIADRRVSIRDYGNPIEESIRGDIFKRFYRKSSSRNFSGAGLGLSIASKVMELHAGSVYLEPDFKKGNSFVLAFSKV